ncbi:MAG: ribosome-associated translation inhibitor RaiA [Christensenellaceae bacterium]|nr:ribosome-associated translation inhibitor RaiA [Christensenellaceae bacterium]
MKTNITAKNLIITPGITNRIIKKTDKMQRYLNPNTEISVHLVKEKNKRRKVEITVPVRGAILRAEASSDNNLFIAIDAALAKIERQIHKHRTKLEDRLKVDAFADTELEFIEDFEKEDNLEIVKRKFYTVRPMSVDDAIMQMELLGHSFFVFVDQDTEQTNVLYLRKDGNLGLLEPEN